MRTLHANTDDAEMPSISESRDMDILQTSANAGYLRI